MNKLELVFKNSDFVVVNKPPGISIHNNEDSSNVLNILKAQLQVENVLPPHRLDKETRGLQVIALNSKAARIWGYLFSRHEMKKYYYGVVAGRLEGQGKWNQKISDKAEGGQNPAGKNQDLKEAVTLYKSLETNSYFSLIEFQILTGRQHQIRKHCVLNRHVLIGDQRYGKPAYVKKISELYQFHYLALQCFRIEIPPVLLVEGKDLNWKNDLADSNNKSLIENKGLLQASGTILEPEINSSQSQKPVIYEIPLHNSFKKLLSFDEKTS